jgi:hypothetical protein
LFFIVYTHTNAPTDDVLTLLYRIILGMIKSQQLSRHTRMLFVPSRRRQEVDNVNVKHPNTLLRSVRKEIPVICLHLFYAAAEIILMDGECFKSVSVFPISAVTI